MRIVQRLAIRFTIVCALVTGAILVFIYIITRGFVHADFIDRLTQQSSLEVLHFASPEVKDVISAEAFSLVNPSTSIYDEHKNLLHQSGEYTIQQSWVTFLAENMTFNAERGEYSSVGRRHFVNDKLYLVFVSDKDLPGEREMNFLTKALVAGWLFSLVLSYLTGLYFSSNALRPVNQVVREVNQITEDNLSHRLVVIDDKAPDEIDELILTFNALLTRIEKAFVTQRRFVQNASHELKTPLTAIMAEVELTLNRSRTPEEYRQALHLVMHETERLANITQGLLTLARLEEAAMSPEKENISFKKFWSDTLLAFHLRYPDKILQLPAVVPDWMIRANSQLLQTALLNILDNACKYSEKPIKISIEPREDELKISITDQGIGIPENEIYRIRSPLFRASNVRNVSGAGLGLSLVQRIMLVHHGRLEISSEEHKGTTCSVIIPVGD